jgi:hypothetical protein
LRKNPTPPSTKQALKQQHINAMKVKSEKANGSLRGDQICIIMSKKKIYPFNLDGALGM